MYPFPQPHDLLNFQTKIRRKERRRIFSSAITVINHFSNFLPGSVIFSVLIHHHGYNTTFFIAAGITFVTSLGALFLRNVPNLHEIELDDKAKEWTFSVWEILMKWLHNIAWTSTIYSNLIGSKIYNSLGTLLLSQWQMWCTGRVVIYLPHKSAPTEKFVIFYCCKVSQISCTKHVSRTQ